MNHYPTDVMSNQKGAVHGVETAVPMVSDTVDCANRSVELWRPIPNTGDQFQVSDQGNVKYIPKNRLASQHTVRGYKRVCLTRAGGSPSVSVHRLVVEAFVGPIPAGMDVHHKNGDPSDNRLDNLEILDRGAHTHRERVMAAAKLEPIGPGGGMSMFDKYDTYRG